MRRSLSVISSLALLALAGCETVEMLQNDKVLAGILLSTPEKTVGTTTVPPTVTAQVFFGEIPGGVGGAGDVVPITGASVQVSWTGGGPVALAPAADGYYQATAGLAYVEGASYTFRVDHAGATYTGTVVAPPLVQMEDQGGTQLPDVITDVARDALASPFPVCRDGNQVAFVTVQEFTNAGASGSPCFEPAAPTDAGGIIGLLFDQSAYTVACFQVPAGCFPNASAPATVGYLVGLTALNKATGTQGMSSNLFLASGVFVGTMDASALVFPPPAPL
ncbi:MAG TPA: hypothetical protein VLS93_02060 [Anaeromyxobacteraceae bacterium]|nr:hypothetical protein [Anaeromyxobacteraceae bacterium]